MPILAACACGFRFKAPDRLAGKRARCPKCSQVLQIPASTAEATILEEAPPPAPVSAPVEEPSPAAPGTATTPDQETDEGPSALPPKEPVPDETPPAPEEAAVSGEAKPDEKPGAATEPPPVEKPAEAKAEVPSGKARVTQRLKRGDTAKSAAPKPAAAAKPAAVAGSPSRGGAIFGLGSAVLVLVAIASLVAGGAVLGSAKRDEEIQKLVGVVILVGGLVPAVAGLLVLRGLAACAAATHGVQDRLGELRELLKPKEAPPVPAQAPAEPPKEPAAQAPSSPAVAAADPPAQGDSKPAAG